MDSTTVYFSAFEKGFEVNSILASFNLLGQEITIRWYGAIIAFGFLLAVLWGGRMAYKWKMSLDKMIDVLIFGTFAAIIGARLYYVIFRWDYYSAHPGEIIQIWNGGLAIYGGIIGGIIAAFITCRFNKLNFFNLLDCAGMSLLIGQGIGRWGNFANQEAFGTNTDMPWGMISEKTTIYLVDHKDELESLGMTVDPYSPVHPTFLYESLWCIGSFFVLLFIYKKCRKFSGQLFLSYGVLYGIGRAIIEGFRTDSLYIGNTTLRVSQVLSFAVAMAFLVVLVFMLIRVKKHPRPIEGVDFFPEVKPKEKKKDKASNKDMKTLAQKRAEKMLAEEESDTTKQ
ncbi:MAG: prolipoprotein diacylglyceryl transferase [Clostridia bacterium]|nr:prolipoprotein diacylglyceryl transferase [Clostridia bacterium]